MKKIKIEVTQIVEITIDDTSKVVQSYESESEMISDLVSYNFSSVLPVIGQGVSIDDIEVIRHDYYNI